MKCLICSKTFRRLYDLSKHVTTHKLKEYGYDTIKAKSLRWMEDKTKLA